MNSYKLKIIDIIKEAEGTKSYYLDKPDDLMRKFSNHKVMVL